MWPTLTVMPAFSPPRPLQARVAPRAETLDDVVQGVAFNRHAARVLDHPDQFAFGNHLAVVRPRHQGDDLLHHGPVQIVGAEEQAHLGELQAGHHPVRFDMGDVVEQQAGDREHLEIIRAGGAGQVRETRVLRLKSERDESQEPPGLVLGGRSLSRWSTRCADRLHVAVEHGGRGLEPHPMRHLMHLEPLFARDLCWAHRFAHFRGEYLGSAPGRLRLPRS